MERLRGGKTVEKLLKPKTSIESRTLDVLIQEFEASSGNFDEFHANMNGREKLLFKQHINSMRKTSI